MKLINVNGIVIQSDTEKKLLDIAKRLHNLDGGWTKIYNDPEFKSLKWAWKVLVEEQIWNWRQYPHRFKRIKKEIK